MTSAAAEATAALAALDRALAAEPREAAPEYADATEHLCLLREVLIASGNERPAAAEQLSTVNSIISCSLSGHFPIGKVPEPLIRAARESLHELLLAMPD